MLCLHLLGGLSCHFTAADCNHRGIKMWLFYSLNHPWASWTKLEVFVNIALYSTIHVKWKTDLQEGSVLFKSQHQTHFLPNVSVKSHIVNNILGWSFDILLWFIIPHTDGQRFFKLSSLERIPDDSGQVWISCRSARIQPPIYHQYIPQYI